MEDEGVIYNFGAVKVPEGYSVRWHECHEHYQAHGPDGWESCITVNPFTARWWCVLHKAQKEKMSKI